MKKIFTAATILFSALLLFSACGMPSFIRDFIPEKSFTVHMKAIKNSQEFEADISCLNENAITISFTVPKELSGFKVTTAENGYTVNIFGIIDEVTGQEINSNSLLNVLVEAIRVSVFTNHGLFTEKDDYYEANLSIDSVPVYVTFGKDGYIRSVSAQTLNFSAQFEISG